MNDHITEFHDGNVLALDGASGGDVELKPNSRMIFRWEWCLVMNRGRTVIAAVVGVLLVVSLVISLAIIASYRSKEQDEVVCLTPECIHTASAILKSLDQEIDPCVNFYNFACGGYLASAPIPNGKNLVSHFTEVEDVVRNQLRSLIEEPGSSGEPRHFQPVRTLYKTCMNTSALEKAGLEPLKKILKKFGNWPLLEGDKWKEEDFSWQKSVWTAGKLGYRTDQFIAFTSSVDWRDSKRLLLTLDQPSLDLSRDRLKTGVGNIAYIFAYVVYMESIAAILGANAGEIIEELEDVLRFQAALASISFPEKKRRNITLLNNQMTLAEMNRRYPSVDWIKYVNNLLPSGMRVDSDEVIMVKEPDFVSNLETILNKTEKRIQAIYMVWQIIADSIEYLNKDVRELKMKEDSTLVLNVLTSSDPRLKDCLEILSNSELSYSLNALYVRRYFSEDARKNIIEMVAGIRKESIKALKKAEWMDETTRDKAIEKAESLISLVAYPVELLDDKVLEKYYRYAKLTAEHFLGNILELHNIEPEFFLELLRKPVNKTVWFRHDISTVANAFYRHQENNIIIPAAILQGAFFNKNRPRYINYGAIGSVIGHEIMHSFDTTGKQFDKDGNLADWWTPETAKKYLKKAQCMIDQYSNYTIESVGRKVDGAKTIDGNIADNGGVLKAYLAYKEWVKRNGPEPKLPGLNYTQEQMFWISAGSLWCEKFQPDKVGLEFQPSDVHSPKRFRVIGSFSNLPEFAADFNCPVGSYMNPVDKCSLL